MSWSRASHRVVGTGRIDTEHDENCRRVTGAVTAKQRSDRNAAIFEARARGFSWSRVAHEFGLTERQAQRIYQEQRQNGARLAARVPIATVEELLDGYEAALDELAVLAQDTRHDGVRLGAVRARVAVMNTTTQLLMAIGALPADLGQRGTCSTGARWATP